MKKFFVAATLIVFFCSNVHAAILAISPTGAVTAKATLAEAAVAKNVTKVRVTSALSAIQSNISSATLPGGAWPTDRALKVEKGGSIANTTAFNISGPFSAGNYQVFTGAGAVSGLKEAKTVWFATPAAAVTSAGFTSIKQGVGALAVESAGWTGKNVAIGTNALATRTKALTSVAVGYEAMQHAVDSNFWGAEQYFGGGGWSVAIGAQAAQGVTATTAQPLTTLATAAGPGSGTVILTSAFNVATGAQIGIHTNLDALSEAQQPPAATGVVEWFYVSISSTTASLYSDAGLTTPATLVGNAQLGNYISGYADYAAEGFVAIGEGALMHQTTGSANTAVGSLALENNTTGEGVVAIGSLALKSNTTADDNVAIGGGAMYYNTTGPLNIAIGNRTMEKQTTAERNVSVGNDAGRENVSSSNITAIGDGALYYNTAADNTAVGSAAGTNLLTAIAANSGMTYIGKGAKSSVGSISGSTVIGKDATTYNGNSIQLGADNVTRVDIGQFTIAFAAAGAVSSGSYRQGSMVFNSTATVGQPKGYVCSVTGTYDQAPATDAGGTATSGSATITGITNSGGEWRPGQFITASARFATLTGIRILSTTSTSVTVDQNANASGAVTISKAAPTFVTMGNL